jgi:hypothetical protein
MSWIEAPPRQFYDDGKLGDEYHSYHFKLGSL